MNESAPFDEAVEAALASGAKPPVGRYRLDLKTARWVWSDEVYVMHGFQPGDVVPTTEMMLSHKHPDDRARVDGVLREAALTGEPFSSVHRIFDAQGKVRTLAVTGQGRRDPETGEVTELVGYFIDVTEAQREAAQREATESIRASAERRAAIEQAKGVLMVAYGVDAEGAFDELRTASNRLNVPVRELAVWLIHWFSRPGLTAFPTRDEIAEFLAAPVPVPPEPESGGTDRGMLTAG
ncbi:PAS and ANTAR domain-containing protein [Isoptericola variabilis]|uniref:histidine kinase n=1 Tax=Isoptericola variabilis (strain 225) TaxID=743718 RepID=F6FQA5_ISOV2|nr:PAS and ANTAR domain-containing protein [Isoptericola variabilis]AEG42858.1 PAS fold-3 domain protein [Isoptericola variabilis 225]TWH30998.1 Response regulator with putative antiterminator output domain [Isoptericola variabilis J7]